MNISISIYVYRSIYLQRDAGCTELDLDGEAGGPGEGAHIACRFRDSFPKRTRPPAAVWCSRAATF